MDVERFMNELHRRNPHEPEFVQAVEEVVESVGGEVAADPRLERARVLERLVEADRIVIFRVPWVDDEGEVHVQRGFRVQMNGALGTYKGGLRFHPSVNLSVLKFLAFEQMFKNALTQLPLGAAKGGSDFDPRGRSEAEVMRFCQSFMTELSRHLGPDIDVPAGDIGVGVREIGFLYGQYRRLRGQAPGVLTGKATAWGGSELRPQATGYGCLYFAQAMFAGDNATLEGARVVISGSGNVAQYAAEKAMELGARVISLSDSDGTVHDPDGMTPERLAFVKELKNDRRGRISEYAERFSSAGVRYLEGQRPWGLEAELALPCATENELDLEDARRLVERGCRAIVEGANMPTTAAALRWLREERVMVGPGKAANAGGVATSGLEMSQNAQRLSWSREKVDARLREIMRSIHAACVRHGEAEGWVDYVRGANVAGFRRVAEAMLAQGVV